MRLGFGKLPDKPRGICRRMNKSDLFNARRSVALAALKLANRLRTRGFAAIWTNGSGDEAVADTSGWQFVTPLVLNTVI